MDYFCLLSVAHGLHLPLCDPVQRHSLLMLPSTPGSTTWPILPNSVFYALSSTINRMSHLRTGVTYNKSNS